jgi:hypothetical protein
MRKEESGNWDGSRRMEDSRQNLRTEFRAATDAAEEGQKTEDRRLRIEDGGMETEEGLACLPRSAWRR